MMFNKYKNDKEFQRDKAIEEITRVISVNCGECCTCKYQGDINCVDFLSAEELYNAGYRKIPEGAVVMEIKRVGAYKVLSDTTLRSHTKEDLIELIRILEYNWASAEKTLDIQAKNCEMMLDKISEETAKKFAEKSKAVLAKAYDYYVGLAERNHKAGCEDWYHRWDGEATATQKSINLMDEIYEKIAERKV